MKANKFRDMTNDALAAQEKELKSELFNLRFQLATGQLQNTSAIQRVKRDIARMKTIIRQRELKA